MAEQAEVMRVIERAYVAGRAIVEALATGTDVDSLTREQVLALAFGFVSSAVEAMVPRAEHAALLERVAKLDAEIFAIMSYVDDAKRAAAPDRVSGEPLSDFIGRTLAELARVKAIADERLKTINDLCDEVALLKREREGAA